MHEPEHVSAYEYDAECQAELGIHPSRPTCLHVDLMQAWVPSVQQMFANFAKRGLKTDFEDLVNAVKSESATCTKQWCVHHQRRCEMRTAKTHWGGLPCVDWSPQGSRAKCSGSTICVFGAWASLRRQLQEHVIVHENHTSFDVSLLERCLADLYYIQSCELNAVDRGVPQNRHRRWTVLIHRKFIHEVFSDFNSVITRHVFGVDYSWQVLMVAEAAELEAELQWACNPKRASSLWPQGKPIAVEPGAFKHSLSKVELDNLNEYIRTQPSGCVHYLQQNPKHHVQSSSRRILSTIIKNTTISWSCVHDRWLCPSEVLLGQGFPVPAALKLVDEGILKPTNEFCSFSRAREDRKASSTKGQAGNSMPVPTAGLLWVYIVGHMRHFGVDPMPNVSEAFRNAGINFAPSTPSTASRARKWRRNL